MHLTVRKRSGCRSSRVRLRCLFRPFLRRRRRRLWIRTPPRKCTPLTRRGARRHPAFGDFGCWQVEYLSEEARGEGGGGCVEEDERGAEGFSEMIDDSYLAFLTRLGVLGLGDATVCIMVYLPILVFHSMDLMTFVNDTLELSFDRPAVFTWRMRRLPLFPRIRGPIAESQAFLDNFNMGNDQERPRAPWRWSWRSPRLTSVLK